MVVVNLWPAQLPHEKRISPTLVSRMQRIKVGYSKSLKYTIPLDQIETKPGKKKPNSDGQKMIGTEKINFKWFKLGSLGLLLTSLKNSMSIQNWCIFVIALCIVVGILGIIAQLVLSCKLIQWTGQHCFPFLLD